MYGKVRVCCLANREAEYRRKFFSTRNLNIVTISFFLPFPVMKVFLHVRYNNRELFCIYFIGYVVQKFSHLSTFIISCSFVFEYAVIAL